MSIAEMFLSISVCIIAGQLLLLLFILKNQFVYANRFLVYACGIIPIILAYFLALLNGTVVDELVMDGDARLFYLDITMAGLGLATLWFGWSIAIKMKSNR